jgi:hypothetical protein
MRPYYNDTLNDSKGSAISHAPCRADFMRPYCITQFVNDKGAPIPQPAPITLTIPQLFLKVNVFHAKMPHFHTKEKS